MTHRPMATPRSRAWAVEPRPSRLWLVIKALGVIALFLACGLERVTW